MELHHNSHEHSLFFVDGEAETDKLVPCSGCDSDICGARYSCLTCGFHLHKSCTEFPLCLEDHPFHPQHPLTLLTRSPYEGGYRCDACDIIKAGFLYHCSLCNFDLHTMCALSVYQKESIVCERNGGKELFRYGSHQHILMLEEEQSTSLDTDDDVCFVCYQSISVPFFFCSKSPCRFRLHKYCADLPQKIQNNSFHPHHPLFLISQCGEECQICGQGNNLSAYICKPCDFCIHPRCALSNPFDNIKRMGEQQIQHFTHRHTLTLLQDEGIREDRLCYLCEKKVGSLPLYGCHSRSCRFILHKSCAELPPQIKSHLHLDHFLFLFAKPPGGESITYCDCCAGKITHLNYRCLQCGFMLHVDCFLSLHGSEKLYNHKHCFINLKTFHKLTCQACGEEGCFSPWQCSSCHVMVHRKCADFPSILKLESHDHNLKLTYYLSSVHDCDKLTCKLCYRKVNVDYAAYYCSKCNYGAHLGCALKVGALVSEEESQEDHHSTKEPQNSMETSHITSSLEECNKRGVIQHFSHQHELILIEQELEDCKYCDGCVRLISPPFYSCKQCSFYLHKTCGESPRTIKHSFHPHLLTLDVVERPCRCDECQNVFDGFAYSCQAPDCRFNLDLQCADIFLAGLQHPCHEHPLFFPYTRKDEKCQGCGKKQRHILVCSECDYALGYCCLSIPRVSEHRYDNHLLNLAIEKDDESGEYYCDICEEERDPETWFYSCSRCEFFAHIDCTLGEFPRVKNGITMKWFPHDHPLTLVEKCRRKSPPLCRSCGKHCYSRVFECCQCDLHFHVSRQCIHP